jgi:hypothetical protein
MTTEKLILNSASKPPKLLREFWPFLFPLAVIILLVAVHALLFWISRDYSESGLFVQRDGRYVEVLSGIREFILGMSFFTILSFALTCAMGHSLWQHKKVIHELWKKTQKSA